MEWGGGGGGGGKWVVTVGYFVMTRTLNRTKVQSSVFFSLASILSVESYIFNMFNHKVY